MSYKYKISDKKHEGATLHHRGKKYIISESDQELLSELFAIGIPFVEKEEVVEKKEKAKASSKKVEKEDSVEDGE